MVTLRSVLDIVLLACVCAFALAWTAGMVYFGRRSPDGARAWLRELALSWRGRLVFAVFVIVFVLVFRGGGTAFWRHLTYWRPAIAVAGAVLAVASTALLLWSRWVLGTMWASIPLVHSGHRLVTGGPYALVRHPIYTGILGLAVGATLIRGFGGTLLILAVILVWALRRVYVEDRLMAGRFGAEYAAYRARVPALLPLPRPRAHAHH